MSETASAQSKTEPTQALTIERKKTKVLKQALKQERKERQALEKEQEKSKESMIGLNTQLQEKEKRYFELYQEKMMLEETIIREGATNKLQNRAAEKHDRKDKRSSQVMGPPVTFAGAMTPQKQQQSEETKASPNTGKEQVDGVPNESNHSEAQSPQQPREKKKSAPTVPQEQYDALKARFIENETATQRRLESINDLESTIARQKLQIENMEKMYLEKIQEGQKELEDFKVICRETEKSISNEVKIAKEDKIKSVAERDQKILEAQTELTKIRDARDILIQEKNKQELVHDEQKNEIERLMTQSQRAREDVECRKLIIDEMSKSMLGHEKESMEMAQKLTLMKNQIMESNAADGMLRRYAAVRLGTIRHHPCTVEFVKGEENNFFMVVDGRHETITINFDNIDQFMENEETGRLNLVYHMPVIKKNVEEMVKRKDEFECAEIDLILQTFKGIRNKLMGTAGDSAFLGHQFVNKAAQNLQDAVQDDYMVRVSSPAIYLQHAE